MAHLLQSRVQKLVKIISSLFLFWVLSWSGYAQTTFSPGDLLIVSINSTNSTMEIVPLIDIEENTQLSIKVGSYSESSILVNINTRIIAGNSVMLSAESSDLLSVEGELKLNTESDQITLLQIEDGVSKILFNASWGYSPNSSLNWMWSSIPNIHLGVGSNYQYYLKNGASGTASMITKMITDPAHWKSSEKPFTQLRTSFRILSAPVVVFNQNLSTVMEGDSIPLNVAIYEHDGSRLTVDVVLNEAFSTADTNDINSFRTYTYNFTGLIGDAVYEIAIPQFDDVVFEDRETVFFELRNLSAGNFGDFVSHATFIIDNEIPDVTITSVFISEEKNKDYIELSNNERVYVDVNGWEIQIDETVFKLNEIMELSPFERRRVSATAFIKSDDNEENVGFEINSKQIVLFDRLGNEISILDINSDAPVEREITELKKEEVILEFDSPQSTMNQVGLDISQTVEKENEKLRRKYGWIPIGSLDVATSSEVIFWDEQLSRFRNATTIEQDSVRGLSLYQYIAPESDNALAEMVFEDSLLEENSTETITEWRISLSATDSDENGIINGSEGYNFVQFKGKDSILVSNLIFQIEEVIGDDFIYPVVFTNTDSSAFHPISTNEYLFNEDFFWLKADSIFERVEIEISSDPNIFIQENLEVIDEPISNFSFIISSSKGSGTFSFNLYDIESVIPNSTVNPEFDLGYKISNDQNPKLGILSNDNWKRDINIAYQQEALLVYPIGVINDESTEISLLVDDWNMEGGWRLFIEDLESNDRVEVFPGEEFSFEYILEANEDNHSSEIDKDLEQISILERYQLLIASPEFEEVTEDSPEQIELNQNYPNPFNPATTISFVLPEAVEVKLSVFNVVGQPIAVLEEGTLSPGEHHYEWNASGYPSGMYIYQLEVGTKVMTRKMTLVK